MKRFLCIFSAFMLLVGCVKNDPVTPDWQGPEAEIAFECPIVGPKMKSVAEVANYPADLKFRVWGYFSEGTTPTVDTQNHTIDLLYIDGAEFACEDVVWGATGAKNYYWPKSGYLHFLGYAPSVIPATSVEVTDEGLQIAGYTVSDAADQDLLVSQVAYARQNPGEGLGSPIIFDHALSSILFKVKSGIYGDRTTADPDRIDTDLRVTKIELFGLKNTGNFNQQMTTWNQEQMTSPSAAQNPEKGWSDQSGSANYTGYSSAVGLVLTDTPQFIHDRTLAVGDTDHELTNLILLPQVLSSNEDAVLRVTYDMTHSNYADINDETELWVPNQVAEIKLKDCGISEWLRGYRYTYNITVMLNKIYCTTDVDNWYDTVYYQEYDSSTENLTNETLNWQN